MEPVRNRNGIDHIMCEATITADGVLPLRLTTKRFGWMSNTAGSGRRS
jgi:hypothetical protein